MGTHDLAACNSYAHVAGYTASYSHMLKSKGPRVHIYISGKSHHEYIIQLIAMKHCAPVTCMWLKPEICDLQDVWKTLLGVVVEHS